MCRKAWERDTAYNHGRSFGLAELRQPGRRGAERLMDAVGSGVAVTDHAHDEVVEPVRVAVIDSGERRAVARGGRAGEFLVGCFVPIDKRAHRRGSPPHQ